MPTKTDATEPAADATQTPAEGAKTDATDATTPTPPEAPPGPDTATGEAESPREEPAPWRTVALALRARTVHVGSAAVRVLGGELVTEPDRVAALRGDDAFQLIPVHSARELELMRLRLAQVHEDIRRRAAEVGLVVYRDGEVEPPKARS